jgi:hypothetical protein
MAYLIGFVTAFIAYGLADNDEISNEASVYLATTTVEQPLQVDTGRANVVTSLVDDTHIENSDTSIALNEDSTSMAPSNLELEYKDGRLELRSAENNVILLSIDATLLSDNDFTSLNQGFHYGRPSFSLLNFGEAVFFCESHEKKSNDCTPFIYDVKSDKIYRLSTEDDISDVPNDMAENVKLINNDIYIGDLKFTRLIGKTTESDVDLSIQ